MIFLLFFKANSEECVPPPSKKARANNAPPAMQYDRWPKPPSSTLPAQVQPPTQATLNRATMLSDQTLKREWVNSFNAEAPPTQAFSRGSEATPAAQVTAPVQEINVTSPFALQHTLPGPLIAAPAAKPYDIAGPAAQNHEVTIQHALAGPSGTQAQTDYANVSIFLQTIL